MSERCTCIERNGTSRVCPVHSPEQSAVRYPRAAAVVEISGVIVALRQAANELDELAGAAHAYDPATLRRKLRGVVLATMTRVVELEGTE